MAVTALLASLAFSVANGALAFWSRSIERNDLQQRARVIFDRLAVDLQAAVARNDGHVWLAATVLDRADNSGLWEHSAREKPAGAENLSLDLTPRSWSEAKFGQAGMWLRFFTSVQGSNNDGSPETLAQTLSAPTAVSYQIVRHSPTAATRSTPGYFLHRVEVRPSRVLDRLGTLEAGYDLDPTNESAAFMVSDGTNDGSQLGDPYALLRPAAPETVLAADIIDFGVRLSGHTAVGELQTLFPTSPTSTEHLGRSFTTAEGWRDRFPEVIDVQIRLLTGDGARQIARLESGDLGARPVAFATHAIWWWRIADAHSKTFSQRFEIKVQQP